MADEWNDNDAVALRDFLSKPAGTRLMNYLRQNRVRLGGKGIEEIAMNAQLAKGTEDVINMIHVLALVGTGKANSPFVDTNAGAVR